MPAARNSVESAVIASIGASNRVIPEALVAMLTDLIFSVIGNCFNQGASPASVKASLSKPSPYQFAQFRSAVIKKAFKGSYFKYIKEGGDEMLRNLMAQAAAAPEGDYEKLSDDIKKDIAIDYSQI